MNTIEKSDLKFVLEIGKIKEKGKHKELIEIKNLYYNLYKCPKY